MKMKFRTRNQWLLCIWAVVALATIITAVVTKNWFIHLGSYIPVGFVGIYAAKVEKEMKSNNKKY